MQTLTLFKYNTLLLLVYSTCLYSATDTNESKQPTRHQVLESLKFGDIYIMFPGFETQEENKQIVYKLKNLTRFREPYIKTIDYKCDTYNLEDNIKSALTNQYAYTRKKNVYYDSNPESSRPSMQLKKITYSQLYIDKKAIFYGFYMTFSLQDTEKELFALLLPKLENLLPRQAFEATLISPPNEQAANEVEPSIIYQTQETNCPVKALQIMEHAHQLWLHHYEATQQDISELHIGFSSEVQGTLIPINQEKRNHISYTVQFKQEQGQTVMYQKMYRLYGDNSITDDTNVTRKLEKTDEMVALIGLLSRQSSLKWLNEPPIKIDYTPSNSLSHIEIEEVVPIGHEIKSSYTTPDQITYNKTPKGMISEFGQENLSITNKPIRTPELDQKDLPVTNNPKKPERNATKHNIKSTAKKSVTSKTKHTTPDTLQPKTIAKKMPDQSQSNMAIKATAGIFAAISYIIAVYKLFNKTKKKTIKSPHPHTKSTQARNSEFSNSKHLGTEKA